MERSRFIIIIVIATAPPNHGYHGNVNKRTLESSVACGFFPFPEDEGEIGGRTA